MLGDAAILSRQGISGSPGMSGVFDMGMGESGRRNLLDSDAAVYCLATGATDASAISDFVKGLKSMGIWSNVACWSLRSIQNYSNGTAVKTLGGLGTFDGTMVNGPTWGTTGISFDGVNDYIQINNPGKTTALNEFSLMLVFDSDLTISRAGFGSYDATPIRGPQVFIGGSPVQGSLATGIFFDVTSDGTTGRLNSQISDGNKGVMQTVIAGSSLVKGSIKINDADRVESVIASSSTWNNGTYWRMGARIANSYFFNGVQSFNLFANIYLSSAQEINLRDLYKRTLGQGLGLP